MLQAGSSHFLHPICFHSTHRVCRSAQCYDKKKNLPTGLYTTSFKHFYVIIQKTIPCLFAGWHSPNRQANIWPIRVMMNPGWFFHADVITAYLSVGVMVAVGPIGGMSLTMERISASCPKHLQNVFLHKQKQYETN